MPKKKPIKGKPKVHKDLDGLEIQVNEFGEIISNTPVEKLNKFLDKKLRDKKLVDRDDLDVVHDEETDESGEDEDVEIDEDTKRKLDEE